MNLNPDLPADDAVFVGRVWTSGRIPGPTLVGVVNGEVYDLTGNAPTLSALLHKPDACSIVRAVDQLPRLLSLSELVEQCQDDKSADYRFLAPCDLQALKACGVTFMVSLLERVIEERAAGDNRKANAIRAELARQIGENLGDVKPGSPRADELKAALIEKGMWSQYLEVAIGPDAEVFTKGQVLSAVGHGSEIGIHPDSKWNNPEPEIVLLVDSAGRPRGAALGNDVNLRDFEGRSALLLGKAKDNNASCAIGPFIRLFDDGFTMDDVRACVVSMRVIGEDGYVLEGQSEMTQISRDPVDLIGQVINAHHQYPDGFMLFLGTMFAPVDDRDTPGLGFTHKLGDVVEISTPGLGRLVNRVGFTHEVSPWSFGISALMENLASRRLLDL